MSADEAEREDDAALAGEYVLGLLSAEERAAFDARLNTDPDLRELVVEWTESLATLADPIAPVPPPGTVKQALDTRLFPASPSARRSPLGFFGGLLAGALAAAAIVVAVILAVPQAQGPVYQARLATEDAGLVVLASLDLQSGRLTVNRSAGAPAEGHSLELWLIAPGAEAPVSLGVIDPAETEITVPEPLRAGFAGGTLAISEEPPGGSPTGTPTTVLVTGQVQAT